MRCMTFLFLTYLIGVSSKLGRFMDSWIKKGESYSSIVSSSDEALLAQLLKHYVPRWSKEQRGEMLVTECDDEEEEDNVDKEVTNMEVKLRPGRKAGVTDTAATTVETYTYYKHIFNGIRDDSVRLLAWDKALQNEIVILYQTKASRVSAAVKAKKKEATVEKGVASVLKVVSDSTLNERQRRELMLDLSKITRVEV